MPKILLIFVALALAGYALYTAYARNTQSAWSNVANDEHLVFFRTAATLSDDKLRWHIPIHGWVYEPQDSNARKDALSAILKHQFDLAPNPQTNENFTRRANLMIADNERGKQIIVAIAGQQYALPHSGANGQFMATLSVPASDIEREVTDDLITFAAVMKDGDTRTFSGEAMLVRPEGVSIVSDIDDTVKITDVTDRKALLENTFLLDFRAAEGMAQLYREWGSNGAALHFVSSSPWQLYSPLLEFLDEHRFPWGTLSLKQVRFRDETLFNLFKKGTETKPEAIENIFDRYPNRKFILVGDSGEQDPEVYSALMRTHPDRILKSYIRNVTAESANNQRMQRIFDGIGKDRWQLFDDPQTLVFPE